MLILSVIVVLTLAAFATVLYLLFRRTPMVEAGTAPSRAAPMISVVVPARNEARNIVGCLEALLAQDYPTIEVIVVDDDSTDATASLLAEAAGRHPRLRLIQGQSLPAGWTGKCFAVFQGAEAARGPWLLFLDADVRLAPGAVSAAYRSACDHGVALLSLWPRHELHGFWERAVQGVILAMHYFGDAFQRLRKPWSATAGPANGQFILVAREAYGAVGGHRAIAGSVLEDYALSHRLRQHGHTSLTVNGAGLVGVRMYGSLQEIWQGWSKNTFLGMRHGLIETLGAALAVALICCGPLVVSVWALVELVRDQAAATSLALAALAWLVLATSVLLVRPLVHVPLGYLACYPLGGLVLIGILLNSAYRHTRGSGVRWKGRRYQTAVRRTVGR